MRWQQSLADEPQPDNSTSAKQPVPAPNPRQWDERSVEILPGQTPQDGWEQLIAIPEFHFPEANYTRQAAFLKLWVDQGWLTARAETEFLH